MLNFKHISVYTGCDLKEFNEVRTRLETAGIKYRYKVNNRQGQFLALGRGTVRGHVGSLGVDLNKAYEYEIKVAAKDEEQAKLVVRNKKI